MIIHKGFLVRLASSFSKKTVSYRWPFKIAKQTYTSIELQIECDNEPTIKTFTILVLQVVYLHGCDSRSCWCCSGEGQLPFCCRKNGVCCVTSVNRGLHRQPTYRTSFGPKTYFLMT